MKWSQTKNVKKLCVSVSLAFVLFIFEDFSHAMVVGVQEAERPLSIARTQPQIFEC